MNLDRNDSPYLYEMLTGGPKKKWKMKPWQGVVVFVVLLVLFQVIGSFLYLLLDIYANGVAEMIFFFGGPVLTVKLLDIDWREVFPVKKPAMQGILGTLLMWFGAYQCMTALSLVLAVLFPRTYESVGRSMNSFVTGLPFLGSVIVIALVPAVSEEILHRGILQYSLQPLKNKWLIITLMGVYFGVFHLSLPPFPSYDVSRNGDCMASPGIGQYVLWDDFSFRKQFLRSGGHFSERTGLRDGICTELFCSDVSAGILLPDRGSGSVPDLPWRLAGKAFGERTQNSAVSGRQKTGDTDGGGDGAPCSGGARPVPCGNYGVSAVAVRPGLCIALHRPYERSIAKECSMVG